MKLYISIFFIFTNIIVFISYPKYFLGFRRLPQKDETVQTATTKKSQPETMPKRPIRFRRLPQKDETVQTATSQKRQPETTPKRPTRKTKTACKLLIKEKN